MITKPTRRALNKDLVLFFNQMFSLNPDLARINFAALTFIPKKEVANAPFDYGPISLVHFCIKIFTKVLTNMLQPFMNNLIDPA